MREPWGQLLEQRSRRRDEQVREHAVRVLPGPVGGHVDLRHLGGERRQPAAQRLAGRQVAEPHDQLRDRQQAGIGPEHGVVAGDRRSTASGARERVGQQRQREQLAERGQRRAELGIVLAPAGDDDGLRVLEQQFAEPPDRLRIGMAGAPAPDDPGAAVGAATEIARGRRLGGHQRLA